jgi:hypothetical protein
MKSSSGFVLAAAMEPKGPLARADRLAGKPARGEFPAKKRQAARRNV